MLQNTPVQRRKSGHPTAGPTSDRLVISPGELNVILKPQCKDNRKTKLTTNCGNKQVTTYEGWNFNSGYYLFTTDTK
jgi:hypothetical protein